MTDPVRLLAAVTTRVYANCGEFAAPDPTGIGWPPWLDHEVLSPVRSTSQELAASREPHIRTAGPHAGG